MPTDKCVTGPNAWVIDNIPGALRYGAGQEGTVGYAAMTLRLPRISPQTVGRLSRACTREASSRGLKGLVM